MVVERQVGRDPRSHSLRAWSRKTRLPGRIPRRPMPLAGEQSNARHGRLTDRFAEHQTSLTNRRVTRGTVLQPHPQVHPMPLAGEPSHARHSRPKANSQTARHHLPTAESSKARPCSRNPQKRSMPVADDQVTRRAAVRGQIRRSITCRLPSQPRHGRSAASTQRRPARRHSPAADSRQRRPAVHRNFAESPMPSADDRVTQTQPPDPQEGSPRSLTEPAADVQWQQRRPTRHQKPRPPADSRWTATRKNPGSGGGEPPDRKSVV